MDERQIVEKTIRPDGSNERIEICLGGVVHVLSLEKAEEIARQTLSLLGIDVAQLEAIVEIAKGIDWEVIADDLTYDENILECTKTKIVKLWKALGGE